MGDVCGLSGHVLSEDEQRHIMLAAMQRQLANQLEAREDLLRVMIEFIGKCTIVGVAAIILGMLYGSFASYVGASVCVALLSIAMVVASAVNLGHRPLPNPLPPELWEDDAINFQQKIINCFVDHAKRNDIYLRKFSAAERYAARIAMTAPILGVVIGLACALLV